MPFHIGIIGYGLSAKIFHIPYIQSVPELRLSAICQRRASPGNDAANDHPEAKIYRDPNELIRDPEVDVVILCLPPETHLTLGKQCLEAGKHIVVEKPFCPTSKECDELNACAEKSGKLLAVFHNRRWDADFQTVLALLRNKTLGRILEFESHFDRWSPKPAGTWQLKNVPGHGVVYDLGSHLIDQIVFALGMPQKITGFTSRQRASTGEVPDDACTVLMHYDGIMATVKCSAMSAEPKQLRFWVRGDKGGFKKFHEDPQEAQLLSGMTLDDPDFGKESSDKFGVLSLVKENKISEQKWPTANPELCSAFYRELAKALSTGSAVPVTGKDGRNVIRLIELALESARSGRTVDV